MPFRFKRASCIVAGTFNMYIVQPAWLAKIGIIPKKTQVAIASKIDEPGFRFFSPQLPVQWYVTPNRIEVETESPTANCGEPVAIVLQNLPWTPLVALGNNAIYEADIGELERLPDLGKCNQPAPEGYEITQRSFHYCVKRGDHLFNLQLSLTKEAIELSANAHTELENRDSEHAQAAAKRFFQDRQEAEALINKLFKAVIEHGGANSQPA